MLAAKDKLYTVLSESIMSIMNVLVLPDHHFLSCICFFTLMAKGKYIVFVLGRYSVIHR